MAAVLETPAADIRRRMDRMYRPQKYIYDLTRKYYLLGRDRLIAELGAAGRPERCSTSAAAPAATSR